MRKLLKKLSYGYFYKMRLKSKFILTHLMLAMIPTIVIALFTFSRFSAIITTNTISSLEIISQQTSISLSSMISQVKSSESAVSDSSFFRSFISSYDPQSYTETEDFDTDLNNFLESCKSQIDGRTVTSIHIFVAEDHYTALEEKSATSLFYPMDKAYGTYWHGIFQSSGSSLLICPSMYLSPDELANDGEFAIIRRINLLSEKSAYVAVYFSHAAVNDIILHDIPFTDSVIYLVNQREAIVSTTNATLSGTYFMNYSSIPEQISSQNTFERVNFVDEQVYVGYRTVPGTDWYMISAVPAANVVAESNTLIFQFALLYTIFLIISILLSTLLSNSILIRLSNIIHQMKNVRNGPPARIVATPGEDEIGDLVETYNYMSDEINQLMDIQAATAEELRFSEFQALQSQINPHFLYNTLDMINWQAKTGHPDEVSAAVVLLSKFYKLTLNKGLSVVTIKDELEHADLYMKLQNMRFRDRIRFIIDVPDEMLQYQIPKLIFQPLVENALLHGILEKKSREGTIIIMGWAEKDELVFILSDDGVGITKEKLAILLTGDGASRTGSNIGVYNTHRRLQLFYGENYGLTYRSVANQETEVEIRIPKKSVF